MIPAADTVCINNYLSDSHYQMYSYIYQNEKPLEPTLEYNYITTEKYIEKNILRYQDVLQ